MKVYKYKDYKEYIASQISGFKKKMNNQWAKEENIKHLCDYIIEFNPEASSGLCHGVRSGKEQEWFMKYLPSCKVIGSEIGDSTSKSTVQWDFNKINPDWIGKFDFIYSNSFDHSFDPLETLKVWAGQLKSGGIIMLEYDKRQEHTGEISMSVNKTDPVSITVEELVKNIPEWIEGGELLSVVDMPIIQKVFQKTVIIRVEI